MATNSSTTTHHLNELAEVIVAVIPWPEHGHLNQLFHLANFISSHNIPLHFISLTNKNQELKNRVKNTSKFHFDDILAPPLTQKAKPREDFADEYEFLEFLDKLSDPICQICVDITKKAKKLVVIYDSLMNDVIKGVHSMSGVVECYSFHAISAFCMYSSYEQVIGGAENEVARQVFDEMPKPEECFGPDIFEFVKKENECNLNAGEFMNSCKEVEGKYLDLLVNVRRKTLWGLGPFHMLQELPDDSSSSNRNRHECLEFLDEQDVNSVIFVSFGTTTTLSREQVNEIAFGLERSNHKFIWVIREADKKMETEQCGGKDGNFELPDGFEERVEGRGVVRNWVPQLEILGHKATGGFLSHCGWNSCMESISMGVPIATWPIHVDQPYNAVFITNVLKIGIPVRSWACRKDLVTAAAIEKAVKTLMGTPEGEEIRQRAMELSNKIKNSVSHGGLVHKERESFISCITK